MRSTEQKEQGSLVQWCRSVIPTVRRGREGEGAFRVQGHSQVSGEFEDRLRERRPCLKQKIPSCVKGVRHPELLEASCLGSSGAWLYCRSAVRQPQAVTSLALDIRFPVSHRLLETSMHASAENS